MYFSVHTIKQLHSYLMKDMLSHNLIYGKGTRRSHYLCAWHVICNWELVLILWTVTIIVKCDCFHFLPAEKTLKRSLWLLGHCCYAAKLKSNQDLDNGNDDERVQISHNLSSSALLYDLILAKWHKWPQSNFQRILALSDFELSLIPCSKPLFNALFWTMSQQLMMH